MLSWQRRIDAYKTILIFLSSLPPSFVDTYNLSHFSSLVFLSSRPFVLPSFISGMVSSILQGGTLISSAELGFEKTFAFV